MQALTAFMPTSTASTESSYSYHQSKFIRENAARIRGAATRALAETINDLDHEGISAAERAIQEAIAVVSPIAFDEMPWVGISDESVVTLRWQKADEGVALFFSGDGVFSLSTKSGRHDHYAAGYREQKTSNGLPLPLQSKIERLSRYRGFTIAA